MAAADPLPMFPLGSTVFPSQIVPLHVFEPRYRQLVEDVSTADVPTFGIALIDRGHEVGGGDHRVDVATRVEVLQQEQLDDGRWILMAAGVERLDIVEWLEDDPYPRARTASRERRDTGGGSLDDLEALLLETLALAVPAESLAELTFSADPLTRLDQLSAVAPIPTFDRQQVLEAETSTSQIELLEQALRDRRDVLEAVADL